MLRILLVEDVARYHDLIAREIHDTLECDVIFATSGEDALARLNKEEIDLVILDLNLPGIHGEEVLKQIRNQPKFDHTPVMILTGDADLSMQSRLIDHGANDFIEKGSPPEIFIARLRNQVRQKQSFDRLTQLAIDRDIFAAGVLHDIRNIETSLFATCDIIQMQLQDSEKLDIKQISEDIETIRQQISRIDEYASSVIQQVRESQDTTKLHAQDLDEVVKWVMAFMSGGQEAPLDTKVDIQSAVRGDVNLLRLVLLNLFQNAVKYARPEERPSMHVFQSVQADLVTTYFRDNGQGIPGHQLRKIFHPFYRLHRKEDNQGHGLGLALVSTVVNRMGGRIWAETPEDGQPGTMFCLELQVAQAE